MKRTPIPKRRKTRRGPMRDAKYRAWCARQWCAISQQPGCSDALWLNTDPAHTRNNGMASKGPDSSCVPLCRNHHREYDAGRKAFEKKYGVDMKKIAAEHYTRFLEEQHGN